MGEVVWTGLMELRIKTSGGLLWTWQWTFGFHEFLGNSLVAEWLAASKEGISYMESVNTLQQKIIKCHESRMYGSTKLKQGMFLCLCATPWRYMVKWKYSFINSRLDEENWRDFRPGRFTSWGGWVSPRTGLDAVKTRKFLTTSGNQTPNP
jgi:hypothetical protein